ncbi:MAG TPA: tyrosine-type recombinase/integrase [Solirubrobacterales bacterium]
MAAEKLKRRYIDTTTRYEGVFARHSLYCGLGIEGKRCTCDPTYYGTVWDNEIGRNRRTKRVPFATEAKNLRADLQAEVRRGSVVERPPSIRLSDAHPEFIKDCREGIARNKHGKPYTEKAITNLDSSLKRLPAGIRRKYLDDIADGGLQSAVDDFLREELSSSRISSVINAVRSLYRWALKREKATRNPAESIQLPANDSQERDRIATPGEFAHLLDLLEPEDALPWALAGYGTARAQEIRALEWPEVDFEHDVMLLADSDKARKSEAARRIVPIVKPLRQRLYAEWVRQGRPTTGRVCPPRRKSRSGMVSLDQLQKRVVETWEDLDLNPIGLQDSRHTAATWLDHAGVSPKVASVFMGHKAPKRQPDAAPITLRRYTHILPGELERARDQLDAFLAERAKEEEGTSFKLAVAA